MIIKSCFLFVNCTFFVQNQSRFLLASEGPLNMPNAFLYSSLMFCWCFAGNFDTLTCLGASPDLLISTPFAEKPLI